jgi:hypothetical protein
MRATRTQPMRVLVACEFSGVVREAFRRRGHDAWSCDLLPSLDNSPHHFQGDVRSMIDWATPEWDLMIAHPPCDRLLVAGALHWKKWQASCEQQRAIVFFMQLALSTIPKVCIENPIGIMSTCWRGPDQIVDLWMFGEPEQKRTCLWLRGIGPLKETNNVREEMMALPKSEREKVHYESPGIKDGLTRSQRRSILRPGFAEAMAEQWG